MYPFSLIANPTALIRAIPPKFALCDQEPWAMQIAGTLNVIAIMHLTIKKKLIILYVMKVSK